MNPKVSVIIPIYNLENVISKTIENVLSNTFKDFELILVDDGSTDQTKEILDQQDDPRVVIIHQENGGVSAARNKGLEVAKGDYIAFIDGDDEVSKDYLEKLYHYAQENSLDWVECSRYVVKNQQKECLNFYPENKVFKDEDIQTKVLNHSFFTEYGDLTKHTTSPCCSLYKRESIGDLRFKEGIHYGEDILFNYEFMHHINRYGYLKEPLYYYLTDYSSTTGYRENFIDEIFEIIKELEDIRKSHQDDFSNEECIFIFDKIMNIYVHHIFVKDNKKERLADYKTIRDFFTQEEYKHIYERIHPSLFPSLSYKVMAYCFKHGWNELLYRIWKLKHQ